MKQQPRMGPRELANRHFEHAGKAIVSATDAVFSVVARRSARQLDRPEGMAELCHAYLDAAAKVLEPHASPQEGRNLRQALKDYGFAMGFSTIPKTTTIAKSHANALGKIGLRVVEQFRQANGNLPPNATRMSKFYSSLAGAKNNRRLTNRQMLTLLKYAERAVANSTPKHLARDLARITGQFYEIDDLIGPALQAKQLTKGGLK